MTRGLALALLLLAAPAAAERIEVGPDRTYRLPSEAMRRAADGDVIAIDAGEYFDCLRIHTDNVTVEGIGEGAVLTDQACDGKALVVTSGRGVTLRNITLQRARVQDGNGAGIRFEGGSLTVEKGRFINNQAGLIAGDAPGATITLRDVSFATSGRCDGPRCANTITVGRIAALTLDQVRITGTSGSHMVVSAAPTTIRRSILEDGPKGSASFQVLISDGGSLVMETSVVQKGPLAANRRAAVLLDGHAGGPMAFRRNQFLNETGTAMPFVLDWSDASPVMEANVVGPGDEALSSSGVLAHRAVGMARDAKDATKRTLKDTARSLYNLVR